MRALGQAGAGPAWEPGRMQLTLLANKLPPDVLNEQLAFSGWWRHYCDLNAAENERLACSGWWPHYCDLYAAGNDDVMAC